MDKRYNNKNEITENEKINNTITPIFTNKSDIQGESEINISEYNNEKKENKERNQIKYTSYHVYEMIGRKCPSCCKTRKFKEKESLINQSHKILNNKLDIFLYVRNTLLFDSINRIYLEYPEMINFLSRPIIHLNKREEEKDKIEFYENSDKLGFDSLYERIKKLSKKSEKSKIEKNLIFLLKQQLNEVK